MENEMTQPDFGLPDEELAELQTRANALKDLANSKFPFNDNGDIKFAYVHPITGDIELYLKGLGFSRSALRENGFATELRLDDSSMPKECDSRIIIPKGKLREVEFYLKELEPITENERERITGLAVKISDALSDKLGVHMHGDYQGFKIMADGEVWFYTSKPFFLKENLDNLGIHQEKEQSEVMPRYFFGFPGKPLMPVTCYAARFSPRELEALATAIAKDSELLDKLGH